MNHRWLASLVAVAGSTLGCTRGEEKPPEPIVTARTEIRVDDPPAGPLVAGDQSGRKFALLVGCTTYDNLPPAKHLAGPANDVVLMRKVLKERFEFTDTDIVTLAEGPGAAGRPTRANITAQFDRLARDARPKDQIIILLGGHGCQQPDHEPFDEVDGLDETFLPCDAGPWDPAKEIVVNAIVDDELQVWTKAITDRGASLWLIVDSCHSGSALRGGEEVLRQVSPGILVPDEVLRKARERAAGRPISQSKSADQPQRLAALYACQADEGTTERRMPPGDGETWHGLLTYAVCHILTQARTNLTYRQLAERIQAQYIQWNKRYPTPLLEGSAQHTEVLGTRSLGRSQFILSRSRGAWKVRAGLLHGLTEGSILAVYPPAGKADADKVVGHVRVRKSRIAEAEVEPCAYGKMAVVSQFASGRRCERVEVDFGSMRLRVGIETTGKDETERERRLRQQLQEIAKIPDSLIELVEDSRAEMLARVKGEDVYLVPADLAQKLGDLPPGTPRFGSYTPEQTGELKQKLKVMARAHNLLKLAATTNEVGQAGLEIEMLKLKDEKDKGGEKLVWGPRGLTLKPGDFIAWRVTNRSRIPLDVTLLFVGSDYGIEPVFPGRDMAGSGEHRLLPGESRRTQAGEVNTTTIGMEHLVLIAVKGQGQPIDFTSLAETTATRGGETGALGSPLGRLLKNAMYGQGAARSVGSEELENQVLRLMSWQVSPQAGK